ncbi:TPA: hypothetical protein I7673_22635 [Vibrio vulnificus]|jgi:hypothetical protein|nr:hypothetical protein [Vibrio vulnificus]
MSICAYCKTDKKLTREHIIPAFLYEFQKEHGGHEGWNEKAGKVLESEAKIKDTCAPCNNEKLGELDGQAKSMLESAGLFTENFVAKSVCLNYDYNHLSRWLLKVAFNSARATGNAPTIFNKHIPYILGLEELNDRVFVLTALHKPVKLTSEEQTKYKGELPYNSDGLSNPFFVRVVRVPQFDSDFSVRSFVIGALIFLVVVFNKDMKLGYKKSKLRKLIKQYPGMKIIDKKSTSTVVQQTTLTFLDTQKDQFDRLRSLGVV